MYEKSTSPDLVELVRRFLEAASRGDLDAMLSFFAPNAVWDTLGGLGTFEGHDAIRAFWEDWYSTYEGFEIGPEEILDLGNGITFAVPRSRQTPSRGTGVASGDDEPRSLPGGSSTRSRAAIGTLWRRTWIQTSSSEPIPAGPSSAYTADRP
jgi:hypothetical protein